MFILVNDLITSLDESLEMTLIDFDGMFYGMHQSKSKFLAQVVI